MKTTSKYQVCEYCNYVTEKDSSMKTHLKSSKHLKNSTKSYIMLDDPESIIQKKLLKDYNKKMKNSENNYDVNDQIDYENWRLNDI